MPVGAMLTYTFEDWHIFGVEIVNEQVTTIHLQGRREAPESVPDRLSQGPRQTEDRRNSCLSVLFPAAALETRQKCRTDESLVLKELSFDQPVVTLKLPQRAGFCWLT
jgi:hypothetical protein